MTYVCSPWSDWFFRFLLVTLMGMALSNVITTMILKKAASPIISITVFFVLMYCIPYIGASELAIVFASGYLMQYLEKNKGWKIEKKGKQIVLSFITLVFGLIFFYLTYYSKGNTLHYTFYQTTVFDLLKEGVWYVYVYRQLGGILLSFGFLLLIRLLSNKYSLFSYWGARTIAIYGIHCLFIVALNHLLPSYNFSYGLFLISSFSLGIVILFITCLIINMVQRFYLGRTLVLGTK